MFSNLEGIAPKNSVESTATFEARRGPAYARFVVFNQHVVTRDRIRLRTDSHLPPRCQAKSHQDMVEGGVVGLFGKARGTKSRSFEIETSIEKEGQGVNLGIRSWVFGIDEATAKHGICHTTHTLQPDIH